MFKHIRTLVILFIALALVLSACVTSPAPIAEPKMIDLFVTCADERSNLGLLLGSQAFAEHDIYVIRRVAGASGMTTTEFAELNDMFMNQGQQIASVNLITHADDTCPGCGGLMGFSKVLQGQPVEPEEIRVWLAKNLESADPWYSVVGAGQQAEEALPGVQINMFIQTNTSQTLYAVDALGPDTYAFVTEMEWHNAGETLVMLTPISSSNPNLPQEMKWILSANETAASNAQAVGAQLNYSGGQPWQQVFLSTRMDGAAVLQNGASFQITVLPGEEAAAVEQLSYGLAHIKPTGSLTILVEDEAQLNKLISALNQSPTFLSLIQNNGWNGEIAAEVWRVGGPDSTVYLRFAGQALPELYTPAMLEAGEIGVREIPLQIPAEVTEETLGAAFAEAGVPVTPAVAKSAVSRLARYAGVTLRIIGYGLDVLLVIYIADQVGNAIFAWGPGVQIHTSDAWQTVTPERLWGFEPVPFDDGSKMSYTSGTGFDVMQAWNLIQERVHTGDPQPIRGLIMDDWMFPAIPLMTDIYERDEVLPIVFYPAQPVTDINVPTDIIFENVTTRDQVILRWDHTNWIIDAGSPSSLTWSVPVLFASQGETSCTQSIVFHPEQRFLFTLEPHCSWNQ